MGRLSTKRTIVVTGHRGFIFSHFTEKLLEMGHRVIGIDKLTYAANRSLKFTGDFTEMFWDIVDLKDIPHCDIIVNGCAESHVDNSISGNDVFMRSNIMGVHNMLELLKNRKLHNMMHSWQYQPPLFVQVSTDEVFGDVSVGSFSEDDRHRPSNPYAASKSAAEQLVLAWGRTYGLPYMITRTTNNYGPRQHPEKLVPRTITNLLSGRRAILHGGGTYVRNWLHVNDNVDALIKIIDIGVENGTYHVASDEELSVSDVVKIICDRLKLDYNACVDMSTDRSGADVRYALNCERTKALGWTQQRCFNESIDELIASYKESK